MRHVDRGSGKRLGPNYQREGEMMISNVQGLSGTLQVGPADRSSFPSRDTAAGDGTELSQRVQEITSFLM